MPGKRRLLVLVLASAGALSSCTFGPERPETFESLEARPAGFQNPLGEDEKLRPAFDLYYAIPDEGQNIGTKVMLSEIKSDVSLASEKLFRESFSRNAPNSRFSTVRYADLRKRVADTRNSNVMFFNIDAFKAKMTCRLAFAEATCGASYDLFLSARVKRQATKTVKHAVQVSGFFQDEPKTSLWGEGHVAGQSLVNTYGVALSEALRDIIRKLSAIYR